MLAVIWFAFFILAFAASLYQWLVLGDSEVFQRIIQSSFDMASLGVEIAIGLIGVFACGWAFFVSLNRRA